MNMKQSCKALISAIEGELDGRHCTEEQAAAILDHALPSLTEALARMEAERNSARITIDLWKEQYESVVRYGNELLAEHSTAQAQLAEAVELGKALHSACVNLLYGGYDRITELGGDCDPVSKMEAENPAMQEWKAFLARHAQAEQQEAQDAQLDKDARIALLERELDRERDRADMAEVELQNARAALATQPAEQWVACSDRLPDPHQMVAIYRPSSSISEEMVVDTSFILGGDCWSCWSQPTHWIPIPNPPAVRGTEHDQ